MSVCRLSPPRLSNFVATYAGLLVFAGALECRADSFPAGWVAEGGRFATPYYVNAGAMNGPTVFLVGGMHGDEPAGACAADQIRHWPLRCGTLVIVPHANTVALAAQTRALTHNNTSRFDLNRAFPPTVGDTNPAAVLAQSLWALIQTQRPDWLLDLHEGTDFRARTRQSVGSSVIPSTSPEARRMGQRLVEAVNTTIPASDRQFALLHQPVQGSLARAAADELGVRSLIAETTTKSQPVALRARQHRILAYAFLRALDMLDATATSDLMLETSAAPGRIRVAVYDGAGNGGKGLANVLTQLGATTNCIALRVCPEDIRAGVLPQFDVVVFPGGSGSGQGKALGEAGRAAVKRFVEDGGGYVGICAGAYLACDGFSWGLGIIDAHTLSPLWRRGSGTVKLELTEKGKAILGERTGVFDCLYFQGPIVGPAGQTDVPDYEPLAFFRTEVAKNNTPKGIMVNSPAVFAGRFGRGRVVCFSPHPEQTEGLEDFIRRAARWCGHRENNTAARR